MGKIFISYRRVDSDFATGRIDDRLRNHFGPDAIFMDVVSISYGDDFRTRIHEIIGQSAVLLAVIGKKWLDVRDKQNCRRIDDPHDVGQFRELRHE